MKQKLKLNKYFLDPKYEYVKPVGDWNDPSNKLIKFKGVVTHYLWERLKQYGVLDTNSELSLASKIKQEFLDVPQTNQIKNDIEIFVKDLKRLKLIT